MFFCKGGVRSVSSMPVKRRNETLRPQAGRGVFQGWSYLWVQQLPPWQLDDGQFGPQQDVASFAPVAARAESASRDVAIKANTLVFIEIFLSWFK